MFQTSAKNLFSAPKPTHFTHSAMRPHPYPGGRPSGCGCGIRTRSDGVPYEKWRGEWRPLQLPRQARRREGRPSWPGSATGSPRSWLNARYRASGRLFAALQKYKTRVSGWYTHAHAHLLHDTCVCRQLADPLVYAESLGCLEGCGL